MRRVGHWVIKFIAAAGVVAASVAPANATSDAPRCDPPLLSFGTGAPLVILDIYFDPAAPRAAAIPRAARALTAARKRWLSVRLKPLVRRSDSASSRRLVTEAIVSVSARGRVDAALRWAQGRAASLLAAHIQDPGLRGSVAQTLGVDPEIITPNGDSMRCANALLADHAAQLRAQLIERHILPGDAHGRLPFAVIRGARGAVAAASVDPDLATLGSLLDRAHQRLRRESAHPELAPRGATGTRDAARLGAARADLELTSPHARHHVEVVLAGERFDESIERVRFALRVRAQALGDVSLTIDAWGATGAAELLRRRACQAAATGRVLDYLRYLATPTAERGAPHMRALIEDLDTPTMGAAPCPSQRRAVGPPPGLRINSVIIPPGDMEAARGALRRPLAVDYLIALP